MTVRADTHQRRGARAAAGSGRRALAASASAAALIVGGVVPATAQSPNAGSVGPGSVDPASLAPSVVPGSLFGVPSLSIAASTQLGEPIPLTAVLGSLADAGSGDFARPGSSLPPGQPTAVRDTSINRSEVRSITPLFPASPHEIDARAEVWTVTSETMQRTVRVEVYRAPAGVDAPNVYFLDGVGSESPSGWSGGMGWGDPAVRDLDVNVVAPTGAPSSMWTDWEADDKVLGPNNWETFLTEELPPLLEKGLEGTADGLAHNGAWGVLGVSMGAASALHLANTTPEMFGGAGGVSGAYSTLDELGYQYARLTVAARHGDVTNMWGPRGSQAWERHNTVADPSGLAGQSVFLSAASGLVGSTELRYFGSNEVVLLDGHILEKGSYESTRALEAALGGVPDVDLQVVYMDAGIHNWPTFVPQMLPGLQHILSGLDPAVPNSRATTGGLADREQGPVGSLGSSGSSGATGSAGSSGSAGASGSLRTVGGGSAGSGGS